MKIEEQCKKCGEQHDNLNECKQDFFSIYNYSKLKGIDLDNLKKSKLKINDIVILKSGSAHFLYENGIPFNSEQYKQIHQENIKGKVININEIKDHYSWGEYAIVKWDNGYESEHIEVSWLEKYE